MESRPGLYSRYPLSSIILYNGVTVLHFLVGAAGLMLGYESWLGYLLGSAYLIFAFTEMYILMPLKVCPNCPYFKLKDSVCISGMNVISRKISREGNVKAFSNRARGLLCSNNLYIASLAFPVLALVPALVLNFSFLVLAILLVLIGLLVFRFFVIFTNVACVHCRAQNVCPQAKSMGFGKNG